MAVKCESVFASFIFRSTVFVWHGGVISVFSYVFETQFFYLVIVKMLYTIYKKEKREGRQLNIEGRCAFAHGFCPSLKISWRFLSFVLILKMCHLNNGKNSKNSKICKFYQKFQFPSAITRTHPLYGKTSMYRSYRQQIQCSTSDDDFNL